MKLLKPILAFAIVIAFIKMFSGHEITYNLVLYTLFVAIIGYKLAMNIFQIYGQKEKKVNGLIINFTKTGKDEDTSGIIEVSFTAPFDGKEYFVTGEVKKEPNEKFVSVLVNQKNIRQSEIFLPISIWENASLLFALIGFSYFIIKEITTRSV